MSPFVLKGRGIDVRPVEEGDAAQLLTLEERNRHFFQRFTVLREEAFYTIQGQADRIQAAVKAGFRKEGIARENVKINGRWEDHQILAIIADDLSEEVEQEWR